MASADVRSKSSHFDLFCIFLAAVGVSTIDRCGLNAIDILYAIDGQSAILRNSSASIALAAFYPKKAADRFGGVKAGIQRQPD